MTAKLFWLFMTTIIYTYLGYPLLIALLARIRPKAQYHNREVMPMVTLLIAAYNEEAVIAKKLKNSLSLDYPRDRLQIIVAADGSDDATADIVRSYADRGVELSYNPLRQGKMAAINRAITRARGEIIVFSDANNLYSPDTLRELVKPFTDPTVGAVTGAKHIVQDGTALSESEGLYWKYESFIKEQETRVGCCTSGAGEVLAVRYSLFEFPPDGIINDDFYMLLRLIKRGYRVIYTPNARSYEPSSLTAEEEVARRARIIAGRYQAITLAHKLLPLNNPLLTWQIISHKFLRPLVPVAMVGMMLANLAVIVRPAHSQRNRLLQLTWPFNWVFLWLQISFYTLGWIGARVQRNSLLGKLLYLPTFLINSNVAAAIGLFRFVTGHQSTLWQKARRRENFQYSLPDAEVESVQEWTLYINDRQQSIQTPRHRGSPG